MPVTQHQCGEYLGATGAEECMAIDVNASTVEVMNPTVVAPPLKCAGPGR